MKHLTLFISLCIVLNLFGQKKNFSDSKAFYEKKSEQLNISIEDQELVIHQHTLERKKYNEKAGPSYTDERIYNRTFCNIHDIKAIWGYEKKPGKFKKKKVDDITKKASLSRSVFYSDNSYYEIHFPAVEPNSFTQFEYEMEVEDPHFLKRFYFSEYSPVKEAEYTIVADSHVEFGWKLYGDEKDRVNFNKNTVNGKTTYKWSLKDAAAIKSEDHNRGYLHHATHLVIYIKSYVLDGKKEFVLRNVSDLFNWYQQLLDEIKPTDKSKLKELTLSIIGDSETDTEKARKIFHWVQDNIRYVAIEDGWRGFIPYPAPEICDKRYGDCKDMTHLMYEMMKFAGISAKHAWIGTRSLPYNYKDTPCPSVDNHLIISLNIKDSIYILDATNAHTPFAVPTSFILGKETLFKGEEGNYKLYKIPEYSAEYCVIENNVTAKIDNNKLVGKGVKNVETFEYSKFHNLYGSANKEREEFIESYLELGQNNFELTDYSIQPVEPKAKSSIEYSYNIPGYVKSFDSSIFVNLNLTKPFSEEILSSSRENDYEIDYKKTYKSKITLQIPKEKKISKLPLPLKKSNKIGSINANYMQNGNELVYNREIKINQLIIKPEDFEEWNDFINDLQSVYRTAIELF